MTRVRWYHFLFLLAILDVVVIVSVLEWHRHTARSVEQLVQESVRLEAQRRWLERVQQGVLELGAPGNEVFATGDFDDESQRLVDAKERLASIFRTAPRALHQSPALNAAVERMVASSEDILHRFAQMRDLPADDPGRYQLLLEASSIMARLDEDHVEAMRAIGFMAARNSADQTTLLQKHEVGLFAQVAAERILIAAAILILLGLLYLGIRMQRADAALELERRRVLEERRERLAAIGELCSSVAHGIRNPLASIRSSAQLLLEQETLAESAANRLRDVLTEAGRLNDRVTGLLALARSNADGFHAVSLPEVAASAVRGLRPEVDRLGLHLDLDVPADDVALLGDRRQLEQVVIELVSNAMEYSRPGGSIAVRCTPPNGDGLARLIVEDDGPGVPPEARARIFDLFYTTKPSGTGIGLATVKRIARLHAGDVFIDCPSGGGTRMTVALPVGLPSNGARSTAAGPRPIEE